VLLQLASTFENIDKMSLNRSCWTRQILSDFAKLNRMTFYYLGDFTWSITLVECGNELRVLSSLGGILCGESFVLLDHAT
jgi:hypothetical protein